MSYQSVEFHDIMKKQQFLIRDMKLTIKELKQKNKNILSTLTDVTSKYEQLNQVNQNSSLVRETDIKLEKLQKKNEINLTTLRTMELMNQQLKKKDEDNLSTKARMELQIQQLNKKNDKHQSTIRDMKVTIENLQQQNDDDETTSYYSSEENYNGDQQECAQYSPYFTQRKYS